jgi:hypothetical protein
LIQKFTAGLLCAIALAASPLCANAAIETDPTALHAMMQKAYEQGNAHNWSFNDQLYYQSAVFATGRAYSLFAHDNPTYPSIAAITVDIASALHYDPLNNNDASEWWVREAAAYVAKNDPTRAQAASVLTARLDAFDNAPETAAQLSDQDAAANVVSYHNDVWARVAQVTVELRAYRYSHDERYAQAAMQHAVDPTFPLIHLSDVAAEQLYDYANTAKAAPQTDATVRAVANEIIRRRDATVELQEIGHVSAVSHQFHLSVTAPADEYFGPRKMSVLGIRNDIQSLQAHLKVGWGSQLAGEGVDLATAIDELHRVYPRDFELPKLIVSAASVLDKIPSAQTQARANGLRRTLVVEYPDSPQARAILTPSS